MSWAKMASLEEVSGLVGKEEGVLWKASSHLEVKVWLVPLKDQPHSLIKQI